MNKATLKQELKTMAEQTRKNKPLWRQLGKLEGAEWHKRYNELIAGHPVPNAREVRHKHIAYSMMRGKKYEQIEQKTRPDNKADMSYVERIIEQYTEKEELVSNG